MFSFDEELTDFIGLIIKFLIVQWIFFWTVLIIPAQENYLLIKDGQYQYQTYRVPQDVSYKIKRIEHKNIIDLALIKDFQDVLRINCEGLFVNGANEEVCGIFLDKTKNVSHIAFYERYPENGYKTVYELKGVTYRDVLGKTNIIEMSILSYEDKEYLNSAKLKFLMSIVGSSLVLCFFFFLFYSIDFRKPKRKEVKFLIYIKNTIKYSVLIFIIYQFIKIWYFLFHSL
ncbi:hypothetical protein G9F31_09505 [Acinetobacter sp. 187]|uniref:hypothetical protein n=1 Tax=Acinetobacter lanii TaxID=2715163 RepID=UPI00140DDBD2|nr:hypothetical protein [Acinetobacter lanii]NHC04005.1 hypothetical protein [Acinetobacter lanii]